MKDIPDFKHHHLIWGVIITLLAVGLFIFYNNILDNPIMDFENAQVDDIPILGDFEKLLTPIFVEFTKNEIKVFILLVPYNEIYLNQVPDEKWDEFFSKIEYFSEKYDVEIIDLHDKYSDLQIWNDWRHIGYHTNSSVYYEDISLAMLEGL